MISARLRNTIVAILTNTLWQGSDGIITGMFFCLQIYLANSSLLFVGEATSIGGHNIVRALAASYERNTTTSNLREYIKEYIGVQYNAVIDKATSGGSNIYGMSW
ncbi:hypothetical protein ARMSODRAFT_897235, partial [Armillaria solidipes]